MGEALFDAQEKLYIRIKNSFTSFKKSGSLKMTEGACLVQITRLEKLWDSFEKNDEVLHNTEEVSSSDEYFKSGFFDKVEAAYLDSLGQFKEFLLSLKRQLTTSETQVMPLEPFRSKLPIIELPSFNGDLKDWVNFREIFSEMVVKNQGLANVYKLHYLKSCLKGDAANLLVDRSAAGESFTDCWKSLLEYYNNNRVLTTNLLSKFMSTKPMERESSMEISRIKTNTKNILQSLKILGSPVQHWDHFVVFITVGRLTNHLQRKWEESVARSEEPTTPPTYDALDEFLEVERLASIQLESARQGTVKSDNSDGVSKKKVFFHPKREFKVFHTSQDGIKKTNPCAICKGSHGILECELFKGKSPEERRKLILAKQLCFNCFSPHRAFYCKSSDRCKFCANKHHYLLHISETGMNRTQRQAPNSSQFHKENVASPVAHSSLNYTVLNTETLSLSKSNPDVGSPVLLATAWIYAEAETGKRSLARALVDQCAQSSLITESLCQDLKLKKKSVRIPISGVGGPYVCKSMVDFTIRPYFKSTTELVVQALVMPNITKYEPFLGQEAEWDHLRGLTLADPKFGTNGRIDVLLSAVVHAQIIEEGLIKSEDVSAPVAMKTLLGWIISGATSASNTIVPQPTIHLQTADTDICHILRQFWETEELPRRELWSEEEQLCERSYTTTVERQESGKYMVRLPIKPSFPLSGRLGDSYSVAVRTQLSMEKRFSRNPRLKEMYVDYLNEYITLNHMVKVESSTLDLEKCYFLPHHGVMKDSSSTTKLRTVFNASMKTNRGHSLNDFLLVGPNLLPELSDLISSWRLYPFVFAADIEKMFRQVWIHPGDQHLQAIVWRDDPAGELSTYFLTTVTFGFNCSPFLAIRTLRQLAQDEGRDFPLATQMISDEVYMDDVLSGGFSLEMAKTKQKEVIGLLERGGFLLRKWIANDISLINWLDNKLLAADKALRMDCGFSVLGLNWCPKQDCFFFKLSLEPLPEVLTKRTVLSRIAKVFDPLGWLAPVVIKAKIFMQSLWLLGKDWDSVLPGEKSEEWVQWYSSLEAIADLQIPRWLGVEQSSQEYEIHGFADSSKFAYAAVVYLRIITRKAEVRMLGAKTKVAPVKTLSIPRLELCAAHLLAKLVRHYVSTLKLPAVSIHLWSDSRDVLFWLRDIPSKWPTFIANRCAEISTLMPDAHWHHINSSDNPADVASRGVLAPELKNHELWWKGPKRLVENSLAWSREEKVDVRLKVDVKLSSASSSTCNVGDKRLALNCVIDKQESSEWDLVERFSSLNKLLRVSVYIFRFLSHVVNRPNVKFKFTGMLQSFPQGNSEFIVAEELHFAKIAWCQMTQVCFYRSEMSLLRQKKDLTASHPWRNLNPILDGGLIRVGGRLRNSLLSEDEKFPIILPAESKFTWLLIKHFHLITLHGGTQLTLSCSRQMFWIIKGRMLVKRFIRSCVACTRYRASEMYQKMASLPKERVQPSRPFSNAGVDYGGPFWLRSSRHRGTTSYKGYLVVFICLCTKAVHLEAVSSYDTAGFIAAFKRFTARRGPCLKLFSDQGTNFIGADVELRSMYRKGSEFSKFVAQALSYEGTEWRFNPPAAPHFGGIWEAAVKSVKHHLRRVIGDTRLTFEEFSTLLSQVEACLNSRPLIPLSDDPSDLSALTPAHFLIGDASLLITEPQIVDDNVPPLQRWRRVSQLTQRLWNTWSQHYLQQLHKFSKWRRQQIPVKIGELVLVRCETTPPARWPLGRIEAVYPGSDGLVRVVDVRTATTTLRRPVVKLIRLLEEHQE